MERSKSFRIDGDLRPIWIVSGRITNYSPDELKSVTIQIEILKKSDQSSVDQASITVDADIPSVATVGFSREVQLLPPDVPWNWSYFVTKAAPK